jgi:hypothetical protein
MAKPKTTINVKQDIGDEHSVLYEVNKTTNTTDPKIGDWLTESDVKDLIRHGATIIITK